MTRASSMTPEDGGFQDGFLKSAREQLSRSHIRHWRCLMSSCRSSRNAAIS